jgi:hypothetical protein
VTATTIRLGKQMLDASGRVSTRRLIWPQFLDLYEDQPHQLAKAVNSLLMYSLGHADTIKAS